MDPLTIVYYITGFADATSWLRTQALQGDGRIWISLTTWVTLGKLHASVTWMCSPTFLCLHSMAQTERPAGSWTPSYPSSLSFTPSPCLSVLPHVSVFLLPSLSLFSLPSISFHLVLPVSSPSMTMRNAMIVWVYFQEIFCLINYQRKSTESEKACEFILAELTLSVPLPLPFLSISVYFLLCCHLSLCISCMSYCRLVSWSACLYLSLYLSVLLSVALCVCVCPLRCEMNSLGTLKTFWWGSTGGKTSDCLCLLLL